MKIGILITGPIADELQPRYGDYGEVFARFLGGNGFSFESYTVHEGDVPADPHLCDGWVISGSKFGAYEDHDWIAPLEELVRAIHAAKVPLVGICFGHQIIAQALGGKVVKFDGGWAVGRTRYDTPDGPLTLNAWHQDQVVELPEGARVHASNAFCQNAGLYVGEHTLTYQAHPEFATPYLSDLIRVRGPGIVPDDLLDAARAGLDLPKDNEKIAAKIAAHLQNAKVPA